MYTYVYLYLIYFHLAFHPILQETIVGLVAKRHKHIEHLWELAVAKALSLSAKYRRYSGFSVNFQCLYLLLL